MARWTKVTPDNVRTVLQVGRFVRDTNPHSQYVGGVVKLLPASLPPEQATHAEVAYFKWDPTIQPELLREYVFFHDPGNFRSLEFLERIPDAELSDPDDHETDQELVQQIEWYMSKQFGRKTTLAELVSWLDQYAL